MSTLYDLDLYAWTREQAALLRDRARDLDWEHLAEELDCMRTALERRMRNRFRVLVLHLVKLAHATPLDLERAARGWRITVRLQREELRQLEDDNPTLTRYRDTARVRAWRLVRIAWDGAPLPPECPYTVEQILDEGFFPG